MRHRCTVNRVAWGRYGWLLLAGFQLLAVELPAAEASTEPATEPAAEDPVVEKPLAGKSEIARRIAARNAFGLVEPAPPPVALPPPEPPPPPPKVSNVQLTGFSRWGGERKVYLVVTKQGAKQPEYLDFRENDERGEIRVLQIDEKNETAVIVNAGTEQTLNFKDHGMKPGGAAPPPPPPGSQRSPTSVATGRGVVYHPPAVLNVPPPPINMANQYGSSGPTVVGRGGYVDSRGINAGASSQVFVQPSPDAGNQFQGGPETSIQPVPIQATPVTRPRIFNIPPPPLPPGN